MAQKLLRQENGSMKIITDLREFGFTNKIKSLFDFRLMRGIIFLAVSTVINLIRFSNLIDAI